MTAIIKIKKLIILTFLTLFISVGIPAQISKLQNEILDENSLLLVFSFGTQASHLQLIGKNEGSEFVLAPRSEIENRIKKLLDLLESREIKSGESIEEFQTRIAEADQIYRLESRALSHNLFGQISEKIAGKRLIIIPDGKLHLFPAAALPLPFAETDAPILATNEAVYESSLDSFCRLGENGKRNRAGKDLLVFSDPVFSADDSRLTKNRNGDVESETPTNSRFSQSLTNLPRLFASGEEGNAVAGFFNASTADVFSGFSATRERALNPEISNYKIIHFATHGLADRERPELSGVALSGFDENFQKLEQVVALEDIYKLNLNADLVVLSACRTGVGKETDGNGMQSLADSFLRVGAKTVVSSLWKIDDQATKILMSEFYRGLTEEKLTASKALRQAQIKMSNHPQFNSPFYWAAFTVKGEYRTAPQISEDADFKFYLFPIVLISGFSLAVIRGRNRK